VELQQPRDAAAAGAAGCLPPGYRLHEFVIERVLGEGGFGVVYSAIDQKLERRVAIKEYMPAALAVRELDYSLRVRASADSRHAFAIGLRSFVNEAKLLARFEHPALIKVYQFWEEKGTAYMVMPFYSAPTLKNWIKQRGTRPHQAWLAPFLLRLTDALGALHREQCLHRDVAPDNILVLPDDAPLLLDFGAARHVIGDLTQALTAILKPGFAPIEQYAQSTSLKQGPWTDVYALCGVAYYAITGRPPVPAVSRTMHDEMVPVQQLAGTAYSQSLLAAIDAGLAVNPDDRPQSMAALRSLIEAAVGGGGAELPPRPTRIDLDDATVALGHVAPATTPRAIAGAAPAGSKKAPPGSKNVELRAAPGTVRSAAASSPKAPPSIASSERTPMFVHTGLDTLLRTPPTTDGTAKRRRWPLYVAGALVAMLGLGALLKWLQPHAVQAMTPAAAEPAPIEPARKGLTPFERKMAERRFEGKLERKLDRRFDGETKPPFEAKLVERRLNQALFAQNVRGVVARIDENSVVTLTGSATEQDRSRAVAMAQRIPGVKSVRDEVFVTRR
jgi:serine/threonine protein kinase